MGKKYNARSVTLRLFTRFQAMKYTGKKNGLNTAMVLSRCSGECSVTVVQMIA